MIEKPKRGTRVKVTGDSPMIRLTGYSGLVGKVRESGNLMVIVDFPARPTATFYRYELEPVEERKPQTQGEVAAAVVRYLMSGMVKNNAYEFDGKPIFDSLTTQHIHATLEEFKQRNQFGEKDE